MAKNSNTSISNALIDREKKVRRKPGIESTKKPLPVALVKSISLNYKHGDLVLMSERYSISRATLSSAKNLKVASPKVQDCFADFYAPISKQA